MIHEYYGDELLLPPSPDVEPPLERTRLSLVYVSSDESAEQMKEYVEGYKNWMTVPFTGTERSDLKHNFRVCATREMEALGMKTRDHEIPSLFILDGKTQNVLRANGVNDLKTHGKAAIDDWLATLKVVRELEDQNAE